jgi:hypothetical protein
MDPKLDELAGKAREKLNDALGSLPDSEEFEQLKALAGNLGEEAAVFVRRYPLQSVFGALALGFVLGSSLSGRRK